MALKLPSADDLGINDNLASGRPIAQFDTSAAGRGQAAGGAAIQRGGEALLTAGIAAVKKDEAEAGSLEESQAKADFLVASANRKQAISDATDPADLEKQNREGALADLQTAAGRISDPRKRELFVNSYGPSANELGNTAKNQELKLNSDAKRSEVLSQLNTLKNTAVSDQDQAKKEGYIHTGQDLISGLEKEGYITSVEAERQRQAWAQGYAVDTLNSLPPGQRLAAVRGGWEGALINRESSGNPRVENKWGYTGLYQFGAPLLKTLGLYTPGAGESLDNWGSTSKDSGGKWTGSFNIPGFPQVKTLDDFKNNPDAQRAAFQASTAYYDKEIERRGLDRYIGQTVGGVPITREGIYSMAHLGGIGGADAALRTGGGSDARDANGSSVLSYARMAANAGPAAAVATFLPASQREAIASGSIREMTARDRSEQIARTAEASTVRSLLKDDEASIMQTGRPVDAITPERVGAALGPAG